MFAIFALIPYIVFFAIIGAIINRARTESQRSTNRHKTSTDQKRPTVKQPVKSKADNGVGHMMNNSVRGDLRDDRNNDWLARQLREEKRSLGLMREMFDLKAEHANSCEAEMLKRFHEDNHGKE